MERLSKLFAVLDTAWRRNLFLRTRLILTALYVGVVLVIVTGFSFFLYTSIVQNLRDASEDDFASASARMHFIEHTTEPIRSTLIGTDIFILLLAAGLSYWFAGRTLRPVERSLEAQRLFAAHASHELRTPLAILQSESEITLRDPHAPSAVLRAALESTIEEVQNMTALVEQLLLIARSEHAPSPEAIVQVLDLGQHALEAVAPLAKIKDITLTHAADEGAQVKGDVQTLTRALVNVLRNAIEHTPAGGSVTLTSEREEHRVRFTVRDTGTGIASVDLPHIFNRFYKGRLGIDKRGSGLGLAMVKEIVMQHRGTISVESNEGHGTLITIELPSA